jgi:anaerobic magnesium-protoporphyrin IX monomethyl ester cyclase
MKILLIQPPVEDFYDTAIRTYPLGLLYVGTKAAEIADVAILDARTGRQRTLGRHPFPEVSPYYKDAVATPFSFFSRYNRYGMSRDEIGDAIRREKPDVVGIASLCSAYERQAAETAEVTKGVSRDIVTVLGGTHPTLFPARVLSDPNVDYCVRGEGETPFFELVSCLAAGRQRHPGAIKGLCFRDGDGLHTTGVHVETAIDLVPNRRLVRAEKYRIGKKKYAFLLTSRGCPFSCAFCGKPPVPYRKRSLKSIEREIDECERLGIEAIDFEDDMLNLDGPFFSAILSLFAGRGLMLSAMNGIYPGNVDVPTMKAMYEAGFRRLNFSLVDISDSVLKSQGRGQHRAFVEILPFLESSPFLVEVHFIIGLPGQEPSGLLDTLLSLMERRLLLGPSIFYLAPGSPLCPTAGSEEKGVAFENMRSSFMYPINPLFSRDITYTFVKLTRFINWVKQIVDRDEGISSASELVDYLRSARDERSRVIVEQFLQKKRLMRYETGNGCFAEEPVDHQLIASFFGKAKGRKIKGFKTNRSLQIDV